jgi:peroxiredoxin
MRLTFTSISFLSLLLGLHVGAEESVLQERPGHSVHGDSFDEGPRRFAVLMGGTGEVHFPVTTKSAEAQKFFDQGVGQLHGFWYYEAERSFRQVLFLDPNCVMAYWGMAMANVENEARARDIIAMAVKDIGKANEIEKLWIQSTEKYFAATKNDEERKAQARKVVRDWEEISRREPENLEAKAFVVYQTWWNSSRRNIPNSSPLSSQALADQILIKQPLHPTHHFLIHLWDAEGAKNGIPNAAHCGPSAPNIAHMWHMPGHIYTDLKRWQDAAWQQEASVRVDHRHMIERRTMPDQIHNYAHNSEWMIRNWNHIGRINDSIAMAKNMTEEPRIPRSKKVEKDPNQKWDASGTANALGRQRLVESLMLWERWDDVIALSETQYLDVGNDTSEQISRLHLLAMAHYGKGNTAAGNTAQQGVRDKIAALRQQRADALATAEVAARAKDEKGEAVNKALNAVLPSYTTKIATALGFVEELEVYQALAEGKKDHGLELRKKLKGVPDPRAIRLDLLLGNNEDALKAAKSHAEKNQYQVHATAQLVEALRAAGKEDEAKEQFEKLRSVAGNSDVNLPILLRINPEGNWRTPAAPASDLGSRPPLDTLGPLLWKPSAAPSWQVTDAEGKLVSQADYAGKPYLAMFFLGKGCPHCVQQLRAFEPLAAEYAKAGLPILAFSTDTPLGVAETVKLGKEGGTLPFPIFSDATQGAFRAFDAYDDFESKPLHGTFLVDGASLIRWQHIGYEPFMRADFLLEEAQRLLKISPQTL